MRGEQVHLVHHAAAENDALGRERQDGVDAHLREVFRLEFPRHMVFRQQLRGDAPALLNRRTIGETFQTAVVIRAKAVRRRVARIRTQQHVSHLRVHHPVQQLSVDQRAAADAGADRIVDEAVQSLAGAIGHFAQRRSVDVGIDANGDAQRLGKRRAQRIVPPCQLRRGRDRAVVRRCRIEAQWTKAADAEGVDALIAEVFDQSRHRFLRRERRKTRTVEKIALLIADSADHLGAAGLQSSQTHSASTPFSYFPKHSS